jgi:hypothetical protein
VEPIQIKLLDGRTYEVRPLTLGPLRRAWPKMIEATRGDLAERMGPALEVVHIALTASGHKIEIETLENELVNLPIIMDAFNKVIGISGLKLEAVEPGKVLALASRQTGTPSASTSPAPSDGPSNTSTGM